MGDHVVDETFDAEEVAGFEGSLKMTLVVNWRRRLLECLELRVSWGVNS